MRKVCPKFKIFHLKTGDTYDFGEINFKKIPSHSQTQLESFTKSNGVTLEPQLQLRVKVCLEDKLTEGIISQLEICTGQFM